MTDAIRLEPRASAAGSPEVAPSRDLLYLYCVIEPDTRAHDRVSSGEIPGLVSEQPLFAVEANGLVAAVSHVPAALFLDEPLRELLGDLPRLTPFVVRHQSVVSLLREGAPALVPVSFGAIYHSEETVARMLCDGADRFRRLLEHVHRRQEWGLKLFAEAARLRDAAARESPEVQRLADDASRAGPGRAYLLAKQRDRALAEAAGRFVATASDAIVRSLAELSADVRIEEPEVRASDARELVLMAACLVDDAAVDGFLERAGELRETYQPAGLTLDFSGPWAPYTFVRPVAAEEDGRVG